jgi:lactate dehydrogenase-like 2-hydroxyacid dehydrogenase
MTVEILMMGPMKPIEQRLEPDFIIHKLWELSDRAAILREAGPRIRGIVAYSGAALVDAELMAALPELGIVGNMGAGFDSVDIDVARSRGIVVTNAGGANAVDVGEHAFGLILDVGRSIAAGDRYVRAGRWASEGRMKLTHRVSGRRLGILGMGNIGYEVAKRGAAFDMPVAYHNRHPRADVPYRYCASALELAQSVDVLVVAAPGGDETRHLVDRAILDALGPQGILVNIARGTVIDEAALIEALSSGRLAGAGLDVFEDEPNVPERLFTLENVVLQPHQGGATYEGVQGAIDALVRNFRNFFFDGGPIVNRVA